MRWMLPWLALTIAGYAGRAAATSCLVISPPWQDYNADPFEDYADLEPSSAVAVPVDARPWTMVPCSFGEPSAPTCRLIDVETATEVDVDVELVGAEFCAQEEAADGTAAYYLRRFIPPTPLTPDRAYTFVCDDPSGRTGTLLVRDSDEPAAPPEPLELTRAHFTRGDDAGCCSSSLGDVLSLRFADMEPAYLEDGGYIEAVYPDGQHRVFVRTEGHDFVLPPADGVIALTPVSASGERGETLELAADEVDGDLVYVPCDVGGRRPGAALWLLAPLAWICAQGRRRRRSS